MITDMEPNIPDTAQSLGFAVLCWVHANIIWASPDPHHKDMDSMIERALANVEITARASPTYRWGLCVSFCFLQYLAWRCMLHNTAGLH